MASARVAAALRCGRARVARAQVETGATWSRTIGIRDTHRVSARKSGTFTLQMPMHAVLQPVRLQPAGRLAVLVAGSALMLLLSHDGEVLAEAALPDAPVGPAVTADFNNDGITDVIVGTHNSFYGFSVQRRAGSRVVQWLIGSLVLSMVSVVMIQTLSAAQHESSATSGRLGARASALRGKDRRSTD